MALRPARIYRKWKRAYTRTSVKVHKKNYIKGVPGSKLRMFEMGNPKKDFEIQASLIIDVNAQIRHNALEAGRVTANSYLKKKLSPAEYYLKVRVFPHHVLREHAQAAVAQADRFYQGMSHPFGNPTGTAARAKKGQPLITVHGNKKDTEVIKKALRRAGDKMPISCRVVVE